MHAGLLIGYQRQLRGALFGDCNPLYDVPRLLGLYRSGDLKLDELITRRYRLDEVNQAYQDMLDGKNIRGVIVHEHLSGSLPMALTPPFITPADADAVATALRTQLAGLTARSAVLRRPVRPERHPPGRLRVAG